jgi:SH3-like domain-containing protein
MATNSLSVFGTERDRAGLRWSGFLVFDIFSFSRCPLDLVRRFDQWRTFKKSSGENGDIQAENAMAGQTRAAEGSAKGTTFRRDSIMKR